VVEVVGLEVLYIGEGEMKLIIVECCRECGKKVVSEVNKMMFISKGIRVVCDGCYEKMMWEEER
jgi:hypothetical protein